MRESKRGGPEPRWLGILEDIRSQNRVTLAAVEASRVASLERIDRLEMKMDLWFSNLEAAIRDLDVTIQESVDMLDRAGKVHVMPRLEGRVSALERRGD